MQPARVVEIYTFLYVSFFLVFSGDFIGRARAWKKRDSNKRKKIIAPFHWPKLKYYLITENIIELDDFIRNKIHLLRLTNPYIFQLHVYLS